MSDLDKALQAGCHFNILNSSEGRPVIVVRYNFYNLHIQETVDNLTIFTLIEWAATQALHKLKLAKNPKPPKKGETNGGRNLQLF